MTWRVLGVVLAALVASGCAPMRPVAPSGSAALDACRAFYHVLDASIDRAAVRDGGAARIAGFPYLRVDRLLASFSDEDLRPEQVRAWMEQLVALDLQARAIELANLPRADLDRIALDDVDVDARLRDCAARLSAADLADASRVETLRRVARVPDDYDTWKRVAGGYWLTRVPFAAGVRRYQAEVARAFATPLEDLPVRGRLVAYRTASSHPPAVRVRMPADALGIPRPDPVTLTRLLAVHAPVWVVDELDENDRIGRVRWSSGAVLHVDTAQPTEYRRIAYTRVGMHTLLQLVYSVWFPARPKASALDLLAGQFDGIVWRVTLAPDGAPLIYDSIHSCGCYHQFFPTVRALPLAQRGTLEEDAFVPQRLDRIAARLAVRVAARTHFLQRAHAVDAVRTARDLVPESDDALRSLPLAEGGRRSAFRSDGMVAGSARAERFVFWPMGVRSPGAMRQWGRHATAFVGRRHFDDARLLERYFRFDLASAPSR